MTSYHSIKVQGNKVFYREAGPKNAPNILLLHGFPTSSHMFRNLIPLLSERYHVIAPDLPGFGFSDAPDRQRFRYTFENLAKVIGNFIEAIGLEQYAIYVFDYGAPVGFRLALAYPERITAIISQNGNAYEEGLSQGWNPIQRYLHAGLSTAGSPWERRDSARPLPGLREQCRSLSEVSRIFSHQQATASCGLGQERSLLPTSRCGGLQA